MVRDNARFLPFFSPAARAAAAVLVMALAALAACGEGGEAPPEKANTADTSAAFDLAIRTGRWVVMLEQAADGARLAPNEIADDQLVRVQQELRNGWLKLLALREQACGQPAAAAIQVAAEHCAALAVPAWVFDPGEPIPAAAELEKRSDTLGAAIQPYVAWGCELLKTEWDQTEPPPCSIE